MVAATGHPCSSHPTAGQPAVLTVSQPCELPLTQPVPSVMLWGVVKGLLGWPLLGIHH